MKKYFALAAIAVLALASCSHNTLDPQSQKDREINFSAVAGKSTKAPIDSTYYPTSIPFGVFAYALTSGQTWSANHASGQLYMDNVEIVYNTTEDTNGIYAPNGDVYYWPLSGTLTFIGYSPYTTAGTVAYAPATQALTVTDFVVEETAAAQQDLMWATTQADCSDVTTTDKGVYTSGTGDTPSTKEGVKMIFHHALSQVKFAIRKAEGLDDYKVVVNSITFKAKNKGTLTVTNDSPAWSAQAYLTDGDEFEFNTNGVDSIAPNHAAAFKPFGVANMPVPQTLTATDQQFTIIYSLYRTVSGAEVNLGSKEVTKDLYVSAEGLTAWAVNTIYTYNIEIGLTKILFSPSITAWDTGASQQINVPGNN